MKEKRPRLDATMWLSRRQALFGLGGLAALGWASSLLPPSRDIFILAGQSNMSGRGRLDELPQFPRSDRVKVFTNQWTWADGSEPIDDPLRQIDEISIDEKAGASVGMSFADSLIKEFPNLLVGLVPCAKGGSYLAEWERSLSRRTLYGSMIARAKESAKEGRIGGLIFYQGESDARSMETASTWAERCYKFIDSARSDLSDPHLPVIVTEIAESPRDQAFPYWRMVQDQQRSMSGRYVRIVSAADLPGRPDEPIHLSTESLVILGRRYANAMAEMITSTIVGV